MLNDSGVFFLFEGLCFIGAILHINILSIFSLLLLQIIQFVL